MTYTVSIAQRPDLGGGEAWQASVEVPDESGYGTTHHSVGETPADALHRLSHYWMKQDERRGVRPPNAIETLLRLMREDDL